MGKKIRLLFAITQFYKGGAEITLLNLFCSLDAEAYDVDFVMLNQLDIPNTISLAPRVPGWVNVIDAVHLVTNGAPAVQAPDPEQVQAVLREAVGHKRYDWAFHIGEWSSPEFVATGVWADHKAAWIHNDLNRAEYFDGASFFKWDAWFEHYIFVAEISLEQSADLYPQLRGKSLCVHNLLDIPGILALSAETLGEDEGYFQQGLPVVVTCANVRLQKNHLRQVEVMALLKQEGFNFLWLNIGTTPDAELAANLRQRIDELGLAERFLLLGSRDNPYPLMARANAFALLSDYESWPMVLGEALLLGTPVVATKTSGALAQITPENGLLVEFDPAECAKGLRQILGRPPASQKPQPSQAGQKGLAEFEALVQPAKAPRALFVAQMADLENGGAAVVFAKIAALAETYDVTVLLPPETAREIVEQCPCRRFLPPDAHRCVPWFYLEAALVRKGCFTPAEKRAKRFQSVSFLGLGAAVEKRAQAQALRQTLEGFDFIFTSSSQSKTDFLGRHPQLADKTSVAPAAADA